MSFSNGFLYGAAIGLNAGFGSLTRSALGSNGITPFDTCYVDLDSSSGFSSFVDSSFASPFVLNSPISSMPIVPSIFAYSNPMMGGFMGGFGSLTTSSYLGTNMGLDGFNAFF